MGVTPKPEIWIDGALIRSAPIDVAGSPRLHATAPTLVDQFTIGWGRSNPWEQPSAAVLKFRMFDPTGAWLKRIRNRNAIGKPVAVLFDRADGSDYWMYRGFTTDVDARAQRGRTTDGWVDGWDVQVTAADPTSALGNIRIGWEDWPAESMLARAVRIRNRAAPAGIRQFYFQPAWTEGPLRALELRDTDLGAVVNQMYASFGEQYHYHPHRNVVKRIPRHNLAIVARLRQFAGNWNQVGPGLGDFIDPAGSEDPIDTAASPSATIDGAAVSSELALSTDQLVDITRVECTWKDGVNGGTGVTSVAQKPNSPDPQRTLAYESWYSDGRWIDPILAAVYEKVTTETTIPNHPPLTVDTRYTDGFLNWHQAESLLTPCEDIRTVYVTGSPFAAAFDQIPVYSPCGGTITYSGGHWRVELNVLANNTLDAPLRDPWATVRPQVAWKPSPNMFGFTAGTSWYDLKWTDLTAVSRQD